ncbi:MAG: GntR family transcriptional regulator [Hyphomicrobiales bacterium]|nr:MAG: GntR family transcriptional regulator [Hyphomicrobiales bacterium]
MASTVGASKSHTLYMLLKEQILSGALASGARLPSEPSLSAEHAISRVTVRRALDALEAEGLIRRQAGAGTFVAARRGAKPIVADFANLLAHLVDMGRISSVKLLIFSYQLPPAPVAEALGLKGRERVQHSVRVRFADGEPFSYLVTYVPESIGVNWSDIELASQPLLSLLERSGVRTERAHQSVSAVLAGPDAAEALDVDVGAALIEVRRTVFDTSNRGVEYLHALYRPDRYLFCMDMQRITKGGERQWHPLPHARDPLPKPKTRKPVRVSRSVSPAMRARGVSR